MNTQTFNINLCFVTSRNCLSPLVSRHFSLWKETRETRCTIMTWWWKLNGENLHLLVERLFLCLWNAFCIFRNGKRITQRVNYRRKSYSKSLTRKKDEWSKIELCECYDAFNDGFHFKRENEGSLCDKGKLSMLKRTQETKQSKDSFIPVVI